MSNGFKKGVSLLVTAGLLASLAATAFAGTTTAAVTPAGATANVPGNEAYTLLADTTLVLDSYDDIKAENGPGSTVRFVVGNGFELDPNAWITVSRDQGPLLFGTAGPGSISIQVKAQTSATASYFDVPIWNSSGDASVNNTTVTFSGIKVRQRDGAAAAGDVVTIDNNSAHPGMAVTQPTVFTLYTLTGTVGAELPAVSCTNATVTAVGDGTTLPAAGYYATCTASGTGHDWAGNAGATGFTAGATTWSVSGPGSLGANPADPTDVKHYWGPTAGTYTATATNGGLSASGTFILYAGPIAKVVVQDINGFTTGSIPVGGSLQFIAICQDQFGNEVSRTLPNGDKDGCVGVWSDSALKETAEINFTGQLFAYRVGTVDKVVYTLPGGISGWAGPYTIVYGPGGTVVGNAVPGTPSNAASPIIRAAGYGETAAAYTYSEPEFLPSSNYTSGKALFPADGFVWTIDISDAQGNRRVHFDTSTAPTLVMPDSLDYYSSSCSDKGATFLNDYTLRIKVCSSDVTQIEQISVQGLKVKADADAALGAIRTRYMLNTSAFTFGGNGSGTAYAWIAKADALPGTNAFYVQNLVGIIVPTQGDAGQLNFSDQDALVPNPYYNGQVYDPNNQLTWPFIPNPCIATDSCASAEAVNVVTVTPQATGIQFVTTTLRAKKHNIGTIVWQKQGSLKSCEGTLPNPAGIHNYGLCTLPSIGSVLDSLRLTSAKPMVQRGLPNGIPFGQLRIEERTTGAEGNGTSAGLLAAGTVITLSLDPAQGVVFSQPPTATVTWSKAAAIGWIQCTKAVQLPGAALLAQTEGCAGIARGALYVPYFWLSNTAHFAPTDTLHGNLFINDVPATFENRKAVVTTNDDYATVTPSTDYDHLNNVPVGQDTYGWLNSSTPANDALLGTGQRPLTLYNPGVQANDGMLYYADLSPDRLSASFKVRTPDIGLVTSKLLIDGYLDVAATAEAGGVATISVTTSSGTAAAGKVGAAASSIPVVPGSITVGYLNNVVDATAQAVPSVVIGANDQATGTVVIREAAGWLDASANHNVLRVCYVSNTGVPELFTRAPWAVVTAGDLKFRANSDPTIPSGPAAPGTGVRGYIGAGGTYCAQWIVYNYSGTGATIEIRGSATDGTMLPAGPNNGPHVNVNAQQVPGPVTMNIAAGPLADFAIGWSGTEFAIVQNAVRTYGANVTVAAVSQPEIRRGGLNQPAGDVTITESAVFQLGQVYQYCGPQAVPFNGKSGMPLGCWGQDIFFQIVRNNASDTIPSVYFNTDRVVPVVSTNGSESGLIAHFSRWINNTTFAITVDQRAFVPVTGAWVPGKITVSGLQYSVTNAALLGPVALQVCSTGDKHPEMHRDHNVGSLCPTIWTAAENPANFNQTVSNAKIVEDSAILGAIAPGVAGPGSNKWTFNTVIVKKGTYVTLRLQAVKGAVVGDRIEIWGRAGKTGTWKKLTTRLVGANGYIFYFKKISGYTEFQAYFPGSSTAAASYAVPRYYRATVSK